MSKICEPTFDIGHIPTALVVVPMITPVKAASERKRRSERKTPDRHPNVKAYAPARRLTSAPASTRF
jgi:hypothetical protein